MGEDCGVATRQSWRSPTYWLGQPVVYQWLSWVLRSGTHWRDLPERYGKWKTVLGQFFLQ
jgi:transposase